MIVVHNTKTVTSNIASVCVYKGRRSLGSKMVIVVFDNRNVHEWIYSYMESYEASYFDEIKNKFY